MRRSTFRTVTWLVALCPLLLIAVAGSSASAHAARPRLSSPAQTSAAAPLGSGDLMTKGGHVAHTPASYAIFWGAAWNNAGSLSSDGQVALNYLTDLSRTGYENITTQYYDSSAYVSPTHAFTVSSYSIDGANPPTDTTCGSQTVQDSAIQSEVNQVIGAKGWPKDGVNATYIVYTPRGDAVNDGAGNCSEAQFCDYHNWSGSLGLAYAVIPYPNDMTACGVPSSPSGNVAGDSLANLTAQAQAGAITDPDVATGWADSLGNEASAKCAWDFSNGATTLNNGGVFELQSQYNNSAHRCDTALPVTGDSVGVFHPSLTQFSLRDTNTSGPPDIAVSFGASTDIPVVGDWNGDGIDTPGVYRSSTGQFFLTDINANGMPVTHVFTFGNPGDVPLVGDWTGSGHDGIGVFRPSNGIVYLRSSLSTGFSDYAMVFGNPNDIPVAGDWSGQGHDSMGVYRPSNNTFYMTNTNCNCIPVANYAVILGTAGDLPIAGDWTHSGHTGIGVFHPATGMMSLKNDPTTSGPADIQFQFGGANDRPVAGHWY